MGILTLFHRKQHFAKRSDWLLLLKGTNQQSKIDTDIESPGDKIH